jgi:hypothetical protein
MEVCVHRDESRLSAVDAPRALRDYANVGNLRLDVSPKHQIVILRANGAAVHEQFARLVLVTFGKSHALG